MEDLLDGNKSEIRTGIARLEVTQKKGMRFGTFFAFLKDIQDRKNLRISRYSQALKVCNDNRDGIYMCISHKLLWFTFEEMSFSMKVDKCADQTGQK